MLLALVEIAAGNTGAAKAVGAAAAAAAGQAVDLTNKQAMDCSY